MASARSSLPSGPRQRGAAEPLGLARRIERRRQELAVAVRAEDREGAAPHEANLRGGLRAGVAERGHAPTIARGTLQRFGLDCQRWRAVAREAAAPSASSSPTPTTSPTRSGRARPSTPPRRSTPPSRSACRWCARGASTMRRGRRAACRTASPRRTSPGCARSTSVVAEAGRRGLRLILRARRLLAGLRRHRAVARLARHARGRRRSRAPRALRRALLRRPAAARRLRGARATTRRTPEHDHRRALRRGPDHPRLGADERAARRRPTTGSPSPPPPCARDCAQLVALGDEDARDSPDVDLASLHFYPEKHGAAARRRGALRRGGHRRRRRGA